ncbi:hypothetical protein T492DRAFT_974218 [Pavlovales sp. CCMP2436]|nr:hypothetical protein T492DRAFT_974218 [Pavlovales sp. CCMP2436]
MNIICILPGAAAGACLAAITVAELERDADAAGHHVAPAPGNVRCEALSIFFNSKGMYTCKARNFNKKPSSKEGFF